MRLWHHGVVSVTEGRVLEPEFRLAIALVEELLDAPGGPLVVELPPLGRVGHITRVEQQTQDLGLVKTEKKRKEKEK